MSANGFSKVPGKWTICKLAIRLMEPQSIKMEEEEMSEKGKTLSNQEKENGQTNKSGARCY